MSPSNDLFKETTEIPVSKAQKYELKPNQTNPPHKYCNSSKGEGWKGEETFLGKLFEAESLCILFCNNYKLKWDGIAFFKVKISHAYKNTVYLFRCLCISS